MAGIVVREFVAVSVDVLAVVGVVPSVGMVDVRYAVMRWVLSVGFACSALVDMIVVVRGVVGVGPPAGMANVLFVVVT